MSVDWATCEVCGDDWNYCAYCGRYTCSDCLAKPYEEDEETGEMSEECCPYCSGKLVHDSDLLEFLLKRDNMTREVAVELYKTEEVKDD